jgi:hypothetical protein
LGIVSALSFTQRSSAPSTTSPNESATIHTHIALTRPVSALFTTLSMCGYSARVSRTSRGQEQIDCKPQRGDSEPGPVRHAQNKP